MKNKKKLIIILLIILVIVAIGTFIIIKNKIFNYIFLLTVPIDLIFSIILINNKNKKIKNKEKIEKNNFEKINQEIINLENEKNILEKNNDELENEIDLQQKQYQEEHIRRMSIGTCSIEAGLIFVEILSNLERIADHSRNIAYFVVRH